MLEHASAPSEEQTDDIVELVEIVREEDENAPTGGVMPPIDTHEEAFAASDEKTPDATFAAPADFQGNASELMAPQPLTLSLPSDEHTMPEPEDTLPTIAPDEETSSEGSPIELNEIIQSDDESLMKTQPVTTFAERNDTPDEENDIPSAQDIPAIATQEDTGSSSSGNESSVQTAPQAQRDAQIIALENQVAILTAELTELRLSLSSSTHLAEEQGSVPFTATGLHSELDIRDERLSRHFEAELDECAKDIPHLNERLTRLEQAFSAHIAPLPIVSGLSLDELHAELDKRDERLTQQIFDDGHLQTLLERINPAIDRAAALSAAQALREELASLLSQKNQ